MPNFTKICTFFFIMALLPRIRNLKGLHFCNSKVNSPVKVCIQSAICTLLLCIFFLFITKTKYMTHFWPFSDEKWQVADLISCSCLLCTVLTTFIFYMISYVMTCLITSRHQRESADNVAVCGSSIAVFIHWSVSWFVFIFSTFNKWTI